MGIPNLLVLHRALLDGICQSGPNQDLSVESGVSAAAAASVWACLDLLCKICLDAINKDLVYSYQHSLEINCAKCKDVPLEVPINDGFKAFSVSGCFWHLLRLGSMWEHEAGKKVSKSEEANEARVGQEYARSTI